MHSIAHVNKLEDFYPNIVLDFEKDDIPATDPNPFLRGDRLYSFLESRLDNRLKKLLISKKWEKPTPWQAYFISQATKIPDLLAISPSGSGKTTGSLIMAAHKCMREPKKHVVWITTDLAGLTKHQEFMTELTKKLGVEFQVVDKSPRHYKVKDERKVIILTPEIASKALKRFKATDISLLLVDDLQELYKEEFLSTLFTQLATVHKILLSKHSDLKLKAFAYRYCYDPAILDQIAQLALPKVDHKVLICQVPEKFKLLLGILKRDKPKLSVVFANGSMITYWLNYKLNNNKIKAITVDPELTDQGKAKLLEAAKNNPGLVIIANDDCNRQFYFENCNHVVQFDLPRAPRNYGFRNHHVNAEANSKITSFLCDEYGNHYLELKKAYQDLPDPEGFDRSLLTAVKDVADNPFAMNFGDAIAKSRRPMPSARPAKRRPEAPTQEQSSTSVGSMVKRFFNLLKNIFLPGSKKKAPAPRTFARAAQSGNRSQGSSRHSGGQGNRSNSRHGSGHGGGHSNGRGRSQHSSNGRSSHSRHKPHSNHKKPFQGKSRPQKPPR